MRRPENDADTPIDLLMFCSDVRIVGRTASRRVILLSMDIMLSFEYDVILMNIIVIATGGTIGSYSGERGIRTHALTDRAIDRLLSARPLGLPDDVNIEVVYPFTLLSENIVPNDWSAIAHQIAKSIERGADGIVVAHGTDTMAYSIAAVSFMLSHIPIPIVFTGALRPHGDRRSDAYDNLWDAIIVAALHKYAGVYLVFGSPDLRVRSVYWGPRVQSIRAFGRLFESVDSRRVGRVEHHDPYLTQDPLELPRTSVPHINIDDRIAPCVSVLKVHPGLDPEMLANLRAFNSLPRVIILDLYHSGTACTRDGGHNSYSLYPVIKKLSDSGIVVFGAGAPVTQKERYTSTTSLVAAGLIPLGKMSLEVSIVKAMCLLGRQYSVESLISKMRHSFLGEVVE